MNPFGLRAKVYCLCKQAIKNVSFKIEIILNGSVNKILNDDIFKKIDLISQSPEDYH